MHIYPRTNNKTNNKNTLTNNNTKQEYICKTMNILKDI